MSPSFPVAGPFRGWSSAWRGRTGKNKIEKNGISQRRGFIKPLSSGGLDKSQGSIGAVTGAGQFNKGSLFDGIEDHDFRLDLRVTRGRYGTLTLTLSPQGRGEN